ncbi:MAG TPA: biliverdin-producing heme oxygenase [Tepidisphaeraceae bacterium]|jgi:heme oxygenase
MTTPDNALPVTLSVRLREQTRASHERIESVLDLMRPGLTLERYARLLERWHGFEQTWERVGPAVLGGRVPGGFFDARRRLPMLRADLLAVGLTADHVDALPAVPDNALPWHDAPAALGVLYVIEGSTLGGQHVAKFIRGHLPLTAEHGISYFSSYGPDVGKRWRETKALLDAPSFAADEAVVVTSANATFDYLATWLTAR